MFDYFREKEAIYEILPRHWVFTHCGKTDPLVLQKP
jgi:hypothetical protein